MKLVIAAVVSAALLASLVSCATVPMAPASADATAKRFMVPANKARVYMVRPSAVAPAVVFRVRIDEHRVGLLPIHAYFVADLEPGRHVIVAAGHENEDSVTLDLESGKAYYLRVGPRPGWLFARAAIYEIPEAEGREVVLKGSLAKSYYP